MAEYTPPGPGVPRPVKLQPIHGTSRSGFQTGMRIDQNNHPFAQRVNTQRPEPMQPFSPAERVPSQMPERQPQAPTSQKEKLSNRIKNKLTEWKEKLKSKGNAGTIMKEVSVIRNNVSEVRKLRKENTAWEKRRAEVKRVRKKRVRKPRTRTPLGETRVGRVFSQVHNEVRATLSPETRALRKKMAEPLNTFRKERKAKRKEENDKRKDTERKNRDLKKAEQRAARARERAKIASRKEVAFARAHQDEVKKAFKVLIEGKKKELGVTVLPLNEQNALLAPAIRQAQETTIANQERAQEDARQRAQAEQTARIQEQNRQQQERIRYDAEVRATDEYNTELERQRTEVNASGQSVTPTQEAQFQQNAFRVGAEVVNARRAQEVQQAAETQRTTETAERTIQTQARIAELQQNEVTRAQFDAAFGEELTLAGNAEITPTLMNQLNEQALTRYDSMQEENATQRAEQSRQEKSLNDAERTAARNDPAYIAERNRLILALSPEQRRDPSIIELRENTALETVMEQRRAAQKAASVRQQRMAEAVEVQPKFDHAPAPVSPDRASVAEVMQREGEVNTGELPKVTRVPLPGEALSANQEGQSETFQQKVNRLQKEFQDGQQEFAQAKTMEEKMNALAKSNNAMSELFPLFMALATTFGKQIEEV